MIRGWRFSLSGGAAAGLPLEVVLADGAVVAQTEAKRVAAVVVTYNRLPLLQKCIASLRGQTADCDVLVVDMGADTGCARAAASYCGK